jgi:hypothetical protein
MNNEERELDLALAEAEQENRLLRARNERLEREILAAADAEAARIHAEGMVTVGHMRQMIAAEREAVFSACEAACDQVETDKWALYKGRPPYTGQEAGRAQDFTQGQADGAALCLEAIKAARGQA